MSSTAQQTPINTIKDGLSSTHGLDEDVRGNANALIDDIPGRGTEVEGSGSANAAESGTKEIGKLRRKYDGIGVEEEGRKNAEGEERNTER